MYKRLINWLDFRINHTNTKWILQRIEEGKNDLRIPALCRVNQRWNGPMEDED